MLNLPVSKNCSAIQTWLPLAFCLLAFWPARPYAQSVGIGTATPHASAQLEVASTNKGVLVPSVSLGNVFTASPVTSPATGLLVWNTNVAIANGQGAGFYYWTGARWVKLTTGNDGWHLGGNQVDTSFHFIGTLNNAGLMFRVANQKAGGIHPTGGNTFLGLEAGNLVRYSAQDFSGEHNTLLGAAAGSKLVDGRMNTFIGSRAGLNTQGSFGNTFMGYQSGATVGTGQENTALGLGAGNSTSGSRNVSIGVSAGGSLQNGFENIMIGYDVGSFLFDGANAPAYGNVWIGSNAATGNFGINPKLQSINNVIIGDSAARLVNGAIANVFVGKRSGMNSISGRFNVFVGDSSGLNNTTGQRNTYIGSKARGNNAARLNATAIGAHAEAGADNVLVLGSINGTNGATASVNVGIGTSAPTHRLYIRDGAGSGVNAAATSLLVLDKAGQSNHLSILNDASNEMGLVFGKAGSNQPPFDGGIFYNTNGLGAMQFRNAGGLTRMVIHNNGNVSIGDPTSVAPLLVSGAATLSGITALSGSTLVLDRGTSSQYLSMLGNGTEQGLVFATANGAADGAMLYLRDERRLSFRTAGTANRMVIANNGNIGMGTTAPEYKLHVVTNDAQNLGYRECIMVENIATGVGAGGQANTGEATINFKNAGPDGTGDNLWILGLNQNRNFTFGYGSQFDAAATRMVLDSTGRLGIGVASPTYQLQLSQNSAAKPTSSSWTVSSDARLKKDIQPFTDGLSTLQKINPIWFTYTGAENHPQERAIGTTAQAMLQAAPYMVTTLKQKSEVGDNLLGVDYGPLQFILVNAIKEQQAIIEKQQAQIEALQQQVSQIKAGKPKRKQQ